MLNSTIDNLETRLYAISTDLTFKEVLTFEDAFKLRPIPLFVVKKENKGRTRSLYNDQFFAHSKYTFYDKEENKFIITESGWTLLEIYESQDRSREVFYKISDPNGEVRSLSNLLLSPSWSEYFQIAGICKIIQYIRNMSHYPNWSYYDLSIENQKLSKENELLKLRIKELEESIK